ncbi:IS3 family transposase [Bacillus paranthracis]
MSTHKNLYIFHSVKVKDIEYYNQHRYQWNLKKMTPVETEIIF